MLVADGDVLPYLEVFANAAGTNASAMSMMNDESLSDFMTVDGTCILGGNKPGNEFARLAETIIDHGTVFPLAIEFELRVKRMCSFGEEVFQPMAFLSHEEGMAGMDPQQ